MAWSAATTSWTYTTSIVSGGTVPLPPPSQYTWRDAPAWHRTRAANARCGYITNYNACRQQARWYATRGVRKYFVCTEHKRIIIARGDYNI